MEPTHSRMKADRAASVHTPSEHDTHSSSAVIKSLVSPGQSNRDIATQLFHQPSTVVYHLHMVFRKLGVTSRTNSPAG
jgi:DNA-binding NarL/FixJ family response regulator